VAPNGTGHGKPRVSATPGLIVSIAGAALAGLCILIVLLVPVFRHQVTVQPSHASSTSPSPTASGVLVTPSSSPQVVVIFPTAITVNLAGGNSGLPEWSPIVVAVIGVFGAVCSAFIGYFVQRGRSEASHESKESSTSIPGDT
jgi:uncharacterized membrane protein YdjX (TVP38/TMEM64 family)